ncbi:hypothetical protein HY256_06495 [Candidatus Sumerlaeota bacterium]|nr:hypothetical protein [Candidatus Sumerlaeota bacterium]
MKEASEEIPPQNLEPEYSPDSDISGNALAAIILGFIALAITWLLSYFGGGELYATFWCGVVALIAAAFSIPYGIYHWRDLSLVVRSFLLVYGLIVLFVVLVFAIFIIALIASGGGFPVWRD